MYELGFPPEMTNRSAKWKSRFIGSVVSAAAFNTAGLKLVNGCFSFANRSFFCKANFIEFNFDFLMMGFENSKDAQQYAYEFGQINNLSLEAGRGYNVSKYDCVLFVPPGGDDKVISVSKNVVLIPDVYLLVLHKLKAINKTTSALDLIDAEDAEYVCSFFANRRTLGELCAETGQDEQACAKDLARNTRILTQLANSS